MSDGKCPVRRAGDGQVRPGEDPKDVYRCMRNEGHQPPNAHVWDAKPEFRLASIGQETIK